MLNTKLDAIHSKSKFALTSVQPALRPPFQRAEQSELEEPTERQWHLQCLLCFALLSSHFPDKNDRYQRRGSVEIEELGSHSSTNDPTEESDH